MDSDESTRRSFLKRFGLAGALALVTANQERLSLPGAQLAERLVLKNDRVLRELEFDGKVWRTTKFARADGTDALLVRSDEFHLMFLDNATLTIGDFVVDGQPHTSHGPGGSRVVIDYKQIPGRDYPKDAPVSCAIAYRAHTGENWLRKEISLKFSGSATVDRLEVERFSVMQNAERGGRGEPVFVDGKWFFGLEYPASHSRHTDGNTPLPDTAHFEKVGNYSFVDLEGRDRETNTRPGLLRLMHFPGFAKQTASNWTIESKTSVAGAGSPGEPMELAFRDYLATVRKPPRSFTLYNNYFDPAGKNLSGDNLVHVYGDIKAAIHPYGVHLDAMVPDSGWQNKSSVWQPSPRYFPNGMADLEKLSLALRNEGTSLGLWLALDGTGTDIAWGEKNGYIRAQPNSYFKRFFAHYSLSAERYHDALEAQIRTLVHDAGVTYFKHDFNHLSDIGEGCGHPPTDRHGHEANVDAMIEMLHTARHEDPAIFQNLTNWMWFSPWWLMHGDALWMLAGDDGFNGNWPEISTRAMASTDRDTYLWRMWGDPSDRPLVPISSLMTHGIIRNPKGLMQSPQDTLQDWADYVMMHYGRGVQLKEWYITPAAMNPDYWKVLCTIHRWSEQHVKALRNTVFVGGRPDEGHAYGYMGWDGQRGVLVARNTAATAQTLSIPFDATTLYRGKAGLEYRALVVYPYRDEWQATYRSGKTIDIELPGYATMTFEFEPGRAAHGAAIPPPPVISTKTEAASWHASFALPDEEMPRCELLAIGYDDLPVVNIGGAVAAPARASAGAINHFASYAKSGMPSDKARMWRMETFDLAGLRGKQADVEFSADPANKSPHGSFEAWLLLERPVPQPSTAASAAMLQFPWSIHQSSRRQTVRVLAETPYVN